VKGEDKGGSWKVEAATLRIANCDLFLIMNLFLSGKNALVCGSTQGIGLAIAKELALLGASCTLMARNEKTLAHAVTSLSTHLGQKHGYLVADFSDRAAVEQAIRKHIADTTVHILINNTGGPPAGPITDASPEIFLLYFEQHIAVNQVLAVACLDGMKVAGYGRIINVISTSVRIPIDNLGVSNTIRGATASWAKTWSNEVAQFGITVNNVLPGFTKTERLNALIQNIAARKGVEAETVAEQMAAEVPARRFGEADEIAAYVAFLATPAAAYINGTSVPVDGGRTGAI
jgi:3-oxoacyl-[acyl-carrier protein] reductase